MWVYLALASSFFLGFYDIFKKKSLEKNSVLWVLFAISACSLLFITPMFSTGSVREYLLLIPKAILVSTSWMTGLVAMRMLPLTTVSTIKASRPVFVVILSILLFGEHLDLWQWTGVLIVFVALWMLSRSSRKEGIYFSRDKGIMWMAVSVFTGVASALYDKYLTRILDPGFIMFWCNLYILIILVVIILIAYVRKKESLGRFRWDWNLAVAALLIVTADAMYFFALKDGEAMLSITSLIRRCSVIITFAGSAVIFKENHIREKAVDLAVLLIGTTILVLAS